MTRRRKGRTKTLHVVRSVLTWSDVASRPGLFLAVTNSAFDPVALKT
jgi:hypothetical protein